MGACSWRGRHRISRDMRAVPRDEELITGQGSRGSGSHSSHTSRNRLIATGGVNTPFKWDEMPEARQFQRVAMSDYFFEDQRSTFDAFGYAANPSVRAASIVVGDRLAWMDNRGDTAGSLQAEYAQRSKRKRKHDAPSSAPDQTASHIPQSPRARVPLQNSGGKFAERCEYHLDGNRIDYQGRTFMDAPAEFRPERLPGEDRECLLPSRWVHTWEGHRKAVTECQFSSRLEHLLLSSSMDGTVKIWDLTGKRRYKCIQTYVGHVSAVKDVKFSSGGDHFVSCGFDGAIKLWDTETGQVLQTFDGGGGLPCCLAIRDDGGRSDAIFCGTSGHRIMQFDSRTGATEQVYSRHQSSVNSVTFLDGNGRFASTSDDRSIRVWECGIPVEVKIISDPNIPSVPKIAVHPSGRFFVGQAIDSRIISFQAQNRYCLERKKIFKGHSVAGYACHVDFSPDGRFLLSGDATGKCWIWNWHTKRILSKISPHTGSVCNGVAWNPRTTSDLVTWGWDGLIKLFSYSRDGS